MLSIGNVYFSYKLKRYINMYIYRSQMLFISIGKAGRVWYILNVGQSAKLKVTSAPKERNLVMSYIPTNFYYHYNSKEL